MNKIEQLIKKLCPEGVEFKELGEILNYQQPTKYIVNSTNYNKYYKIPVLTAGQSFILGYTDELNGIFKANSQNPVIIFDDFTTSFHWVDFDFKIKSSAIKILYLKEDEKVIFRYIYYAMKCIAYKPQDHARQWISKYSKFQIPIPPLSIQEEIVKILDTFTQLEAELEAELEARKKQYEYYRNELLQADENGVMTNGVKAEWKLLGEIIKSLKTGLNPRKNFKLNTEYAKNYYVTVRELNGLDIRFYDKTDKVDDNGLILINNRSNLEIGDILFSGTGTIGKTALITSVPTNWNIKEGVYSIKPISEIIIPKFLLFYLNSTEAKNQIKNNIDGSSVMSIPMNKLKQIKIPIPPLSEQNRIVAILDKFDALVNDISVGLPAEITARRKQYEYYREKLLTFKECSHEGK